MRDFEFHLEKILAYKDQNLDSELMNLGALYNSLRQAEEKLSDLHAEQDACRTRYDAAIQENATVAACTVCLNYTDYLTLQIKECRKEVNQIRDRVSEQIDLVKSLKVETKSLETIKESRYEAYKHETSKREERQIEEYVVSAAAIAKGF
ncbi:MAG: flagellar FliJ family protein [Eubacteriales bacterium]|jgi:flagellar export protein FliJ|nr:flagellar FliJ family protein [Eubacteriales bacterium]MDD3289453.1 flagellar FliJ family protein [Eubacteriales bacterium]MDD3863243.1 flagellar FliJ family protein [Eubacteriales bacterium]MDD4444359.1 flagellar FliJ family protein [Eubacteriales bacterium]